MTEQERKLLILTAQAIDAHQSTYYRKLLDAQLQAMDEPLTPYPQLPPLKFPWRWWPVWAAVLMGVIAITAWCCTPASSVASAAKIHTMQDANCARWAKAHDIVGWWGSVPIAFVGAECLETKK